MHGGSHAELLSSSGTFSTISDAGQGAILIASDRLHPLQCRMARAALGWSLDDLAKAAGVERKTILRFEQGTTDMRPSTRAAARGAMEAAGAVFIDDGEHAGGVVPPALGKHLSN
jgi:DNA-binding XRE family transcriptional regulator